MAASACLSYGSQVIGGTLRDQPSKRCVITNVFMGNGNLKRMMALTQGMKVVETGLGSSSSSPGARGVRCSVGIGDFIGGDLLKFDLGQWLSDVEEHKALAIYTPHEGGYEGRYFTRLRYQVMEDCKISYRYSLVQLRIVVYHSRCCYLCYMVLLLAESLS